MELTDMTQRPDAPTDSKGDGSHKKSKLKRSKSLLRPAVRSPQNKALVQTDPLFHLYLICVGLITLSILAIKCLIPGMPIYTHTIIGFAFLLLTIVVSAIYTQAKGRKINIQFRILLWLIISSSLTMLQLVDLIVLDDLTAFTATNDIDLETITSFECPTEWATIVESKKCYFHQYYTFTIIVAMTATSIFIRINVWLKFLMHASTIVFYFIINNPPATMYETLKRSLQTPHTFVWPLMDRTQELSHLFYIVMIAVILHLIDRQVEYILSLNIQWNEQLESDRIESQTVGSINRILLENILPPHVLKRYLYNNAVSYDQLYHESHPSCGVMFASIPNYESFYTENHLNEQGLKCLQLLNEIICDFDQLLSYPAFRSIEKIKTIGSTYMAACFDAMRRTSDCTLEGHELGPGAHCSDISSKTTGWLNPGLVLTGTSPCLSLKAFSETIMRDSLQQPAPEALSNRESSDYLDSVEMNNVVTMVCFATALMENLARINRDAFQEFRLRIGIATGPVIAGVVGATKPTYDIWGDTVNVASRLESNGILGRIQVSEEVANILKKHGQFEVDCRGPVFVKGKGHLTTYLVQTPYDSYESGDSATELEPVPESPSKAASVALASRQASNELEDAANTSCGQEVSSD